MVLNFGGRKIRKPGEKPSRQARTKNKLNPHEAPRHESSPGQIRGKRALSPMLHPRSPYVDQDGDDHDEIEKLPFVFVL